MIPIPPSRAIAIAILDSVTVSIAEVMIGVLSTISLVRCVWISTISGVQSDSPGMSSTSSKVMPSFANFLFSFVSSIFITSHFFFKRSLQKYYSLSYTILLQKSTALCVQKMNFGFPKNSRRHFFAVSEKSLQFRLKKSENCVIL